MQLTYLLVLLPLALAAPTPQGSYASYGDYSDVSAPAGSYADYGDYSDASGYASYGDYANPAPADGNPYGAYGDYGAYKREANPAPVAEPEAEAAAEPVAKE